MAVNTKTKNVEPQVSKLAWNEKVTLTRRRYIVISRGAKCYKVGAASWRKFGVVNHPVGSRGRARGRYEVLISKRFDEIAFLCGDSWLKENFV